MKRPKDYRMDKGLSQNDLSTLCDVAQSTIYNVESGAFYSLNVLKKISAQLGIDFIEYLKSVEGERIKQKLKKQD
jgi:transcriptional regulator with XRE-family HTH domain